MAEEETQTKEIEPEVKEENQEAPPQEEQEAGYEDDVEPGGAEPQAVRARKEYRARKRAEEENRELRESLYKLQGQVDVLTQQASKLAQPPTEKEWTSDQLQRAVDEGRIEDNPEIRAEIRRRQKREIAQDVLSGVMTHQGKIDSFRRAQETFDSYREAIPALDDKNSEEFRSVIREMETLVAGGLENNIVTQTLAVKAAMGPLGRYQKRKDADRFSRENRETVKEVGGGERPGESGQNWKKGLPKDLLDHWAFRGFSEKEQKELAKHYTPPKRRSA